ncbi:hypothetical protein HDU91_003321, partial [Kappamyces sp. JEL0680]
MSCITVGLGTLTATPGDMSALALAAFVLRDIVLAGYHGTLMYIAASYTAKDDQTCVANSSILPWLIFDLCITTMRLFKNPFQYWANRVVERTGAGWTIPEDLPRWVRFFGPSNTFCQMRIYTTIDWLTYLSWIVGAWAIRPVSNCSQFPVVAAYYEISGSTIFYVCSIMAYILSFMANRLSSGRLCPGFVIDNGNWPDTCPAIRFDRSQWKRRDETFSEYRERVVSHFEEMEAAMVTEEPFWMDDMETEVQNLTREEINSLKVITFRKKATTDAVPSVRVQTALTASQETLGEEPHAGEDPPRLSSDSSRTIRNKKPLMVRPAAELRR